MKNKSLQQLAQAFSKQKNEQQMLTFLEGILTPKEIEEFAARIEIVKMLKAGVPQREIAEKLGVGIATVTRGSKEVQNGKFENV